MNTWQRIRNILAERLEDDDARGAVAGAFAQFARQHPDWVGALFDEHFLSHGAAAVLNEYLARAQPARPTPALAVNWRAPYAYWLAEAWARQMADRRAARQRLAEAMRVAGDFLLALDAALAHPQLQPAGSAQPEHASAPLRLGVPGRAGVAPPGLAGSRL
ncbi:MAG: hypothetical protein JNK29_19545 [Anaerolineales bacterium]|nr:hypothetical protein [Anaerolineales bacterium]